MDDDVRNDGLDLGDQDTLVEIQYLGVPHHIGGVEGTDQLPQEAGIIGDLHSHLPEGTDPEPDMVLRVNQLDWVRGAPCKIQLGHGIYVVDLRREGSFSAKWQVDDALQQRQVVGAEGIGARGKYVANGAALYENRNLTLSHDQLGAKGNAVLGMLIHQPVTGHKSAKLDYVEDCHRITPFDQIR